MPVKEDAAPQVQQTKAPVEQPIGAQPMIHTAEGKIVPKGPPAAEEDVVDPVHGKPKTKEEMLKIVAKATEERTRK